MQFKKFTDRNFIPSSCLFISYQETSLDVLLDHECNDLGSEQEVNSSMELCTGRRKEFPEIFDYQLTNRYRFEFTGTDIDYLGLKSRKHDFYIGGTDACQGK